jgi:hypothetical protein
MDYSNEMNMVKGYDSPAKSQRLNLPTAIDQAFEVIDRQEKILEELRIKLSPFCKPPRTEPIDAIRPAPGQEPQIPRDVSELTSRVINLGDEIDRRNRKIIDLMNLIDV